MPAPNPLAADLDHVLEIMGSLWEDLRGARLFITGGTGFVGCWLLETLLWANDRLGLGASAVVLTRDAAAFRKRVPHLATNPVVTLHGGDVRSFAFPESSFSHVIHGATASAAPEPPAVTFDTIVEGTRRTLEVAEQSRASRFLLVSSGAVYGKQPPALERIPEEYSGAPDPAVAANAYGEGKRAAETLCTLRASESLEPVIARCFAFLGPYLPLNAHFAVGNFIRDGLAGGPIRVLGDGTAYRSYLYASDLAVWLWTMLLLGRSLRPYNVGSPRALSIESLANDVAAAFGPGIGVRVARTPVAGSLPERYVPDVARAEEELGLTPTVPLDEALRRTRKWHETFAVPLRAVQG